MALSIGRLLWASYGFRFSQNLKKVRLKRGVTQQALAEIAGLSRTQVCNLERNENNSGTSADPALSTVYKLALALEVPPALLLPQPDDIVRSVCATAATQAAHEKIQAAELSEVVSTESLPTESVPAGRSQALAVRAPKHRAPNLSAQKLYPNGEANGLSLEDLAPFSPEYTAYKRRAATTKRNKVPSETAQPQRITTTRWPRKEVGEQP